MNKSSWQINSSFKILRIQSFFVKYSHPKLHFFAYFRAPVPAAALHSLFRNKRVMLMEIFLQNALEFSYFLNTKTEVFFAQSGKKTLWVFVF